MIQIKATEIDEAYLELVNKVLNEGEAIVLTPLLESEAEQLIQSVSIIEDYLKYPVNKLDFTHRVALMNICNFKDEVIKSLKDGEE